MTRRPVQLPVSILALLLMLALPARAQVGPPSAPARHPWVTQRTAAFIEAANLHSHALDSLPEPSKAGLWIVQDARGGLISSGILPDFPTRFALANYAFIHMKRAHMRAWLLVTWLLLCLPSRGVAQTPDSVAAGEIVRLEHRIEAAVARARPADLTFLDSVYATQFRFKHATGEIQDRSQWLAFVRGRLARWAARDVDSLDVEVHDDVALVTGRIHVRREAGAPGSGPPAYTIRYVRLYSRRAGHWQLLSHHSTALSPDSTTAPAARPEGAVGQAPRFHRHPALDYPHKVDT